MIILGLLGGLGTVGVFVLRGVAASSSQHFKGIQKKKFRSAIVQFVYKLLFREITRFERMEKRHI